MRIIYNKMGEILEMEGFETSKNWLDFGMFLVWSQEFVFTF